ncbi:MAG: hypothetical protein RL632_1641 [Bacteroidota bacterium]
MLIYSVLFAVSLFVFVRYSRFFRTEGLSSWTLPLAFILKVGVGLLLFWVHIRTYGIGELSHDGERFFNEGRLLHEVFYKSPWDYLRLLTGIGETEALTQHYLSTTRYWSAGDLTIINDAKNVIRCHSLLHFISFNSVYVHLIAICLLSTAALRNLYLAFKGNSHFSNALFFWIILLIPSTIFWTSSMMKEPFMFFGISLFLRALIVETNPIKKYIWLFAASFILLAFKPYILLCLIGAVLCVALYTYLFKQRFFAFILFMCITVPVLSFLFPGSRDTVVHYLTRKQFDFVNVGKGGLHVQSDTCFYFFQSDQISSLDVNGYTAELKKEINVYRYRFGSTQKPVPVHLVPNGEKWIIVYQALGCSSFIELTPIDDSYQQLLANIPEALFNAGIRPLPNDPGSKLKYLSMLEVWVLVAFLVYAIIHKRKIGKKEKNLILGLIFFALFLLVLIGWTTPVLGAITRYRFPAQLALVLVGLILIQPKSITLWKKQS